MNSGHVKSVRDLFDAKARGWSNKYSGYLRFRRALFVDTIECTLAHGSRVLDLGCGSGVYLKELSDLGYDVAGIDISSEMLACCRKQFPSDTPPALYQSTIEECAGTIGTFDCVFSSSVFEYLDDPTSTLTSIHRVLRDGGHVFLTIPNRHSRRKRAEAIARVFVPLVRHIPLPHRIRGFVQYLQLSKNHITRDELVNMAANANLRCESVEYFDPLLGDLSNDSWRGEMLFAHLRRSDHASD